MSNRGPYFACSTCILGRCWDCDNSCFCKCHETEIALRCNDENTADFKLDKAIGWIDKAISDSCGEEAGKKWCEDFGCGALLKIRDILIGK